MKNNKTLIWIVITLTFFVGIAITVFSVVNIDANFMLYAILLFIGIFLTLLGLNIFLRLLKTRKS